MPSAERKSGMPQEVDTPAPLRTRILLELRINRTTSSTVLTSGSLARRRKTREIAILSTRRRWPSSSPISPVGGCWFASALFTVTELEWGTDNDKAESYEQLAQGNLVTDVVLCETRRGGQIQLSDKSTCALSPV